MADAKKVSELPVATEVTLSDLMYLVQSGTSKQTSAYILAGYILGSSNRNIATTGTASVGAVSSTGLSSFTSESVSIALTSTTCYGGGGAGLQCKKSRGTAASPTAVTTGDFIGGVISAGHNGTTYSGNVGGLGHYAAEDFTPSAAGTYFTVATTPIGGTSRVERFRVTDTGNMLLGSTSAVTGAKLEVTGNISGTALKLTALPTSSAGLTTGDIWNDNGTLKIV